jgi:SAM-dependent methyltransferase
MNDRWAREQYPNEYQKDVNESIGFSGLDMDMFTRGKVDSMASVLTRFSATLPSDVECLDIGCGIGAAHPMLAGKVGKLAGADVSQEAIETARAANPAVDYDTYSGERLPFCDGRFDFSTTSCVMHHVPPDQWPNFVAEAWRVTKPGGLFTVYEHNPLNPLTRVAVWRCPFDHDAVLLRAKDVIELLEAQGFTIVAKEYLFFTPVDAPWARRIDRALAWLPIGAQYVVCGRKPA